MKIPLKIKWLQKSINYGKKVFNFASGIIIVVLCFCLAMCQYDRDNEETNSWKWPLGQLILMSFAYIVALIASDSKVISPAVLH
jgi:hypothetical protein